MPRDKRAYIHQAFPLLMRKRTLAVFLDITDGTIDKWVEKKWLPSPIRVDNVVCWSRTSVEHAVMELEVKFGLEFLEGELDGENPFDEIIS